MTLDDSHPMDHSLKECSNATTEFEMESTKQKFAYKSIVETN